MIYKAVIVDDEPLIREGLKKMIPWEECSLELVGCAANGDAALKLLEAEPADILITDIKMPRMNGLELMHRCSEAGMRMKYVVLSGYTDFELVKEAAQIGIENYLIKPVDKIEMLQTLMQIVEKLNVEQTQQTILNEGISILRENLIYRWIVGEIAFDELLERKDYLGFKLERDYLVGILKIVPRYHGEQSQARSDEKNMLMDKVRSVIEKFQMGTSVVDPAGRLLMLFSNVRIQRRQIEQNLEELVRYVRKNSRFRIFVAMGTIVGEPEDVGSSYDDARFTLENYELCSDKDIVWFEAVRQCMDAIPHFSYDQLLGLNDKFNMDDRASIFNTVDTVMEGMGRTPGVKPEMLQAFGVIIVIHIFQNIINYKANAEIEIVHLQEKIPEIYQIYCVEEMILWMKRMIDSALEISSQIECQYSVVVSNVIHYLEANYEKDICIKVVADAFHMNPLYIGRLFRQETGSAFTDYLNILRLEKAKALLEHTQIPMKQIAQEVGYQNSNYFFTVFKKCVGMTPTEFRRRSSPDI